MAISYVSSVYAVSTGGGGGGEGITSLNGQTGLTQTFATGTAGTNFGISSSSGVHTFNLPTASASNRGLLSSADWSTFNGKAAGSHTHAISDITNLQTSLDAKLESVDFTDLTGSLDVTQVPDGELTIAKTSGLQTALDAKVESLSDLGLTATATELNYVDGVTSAIQTQLDAKAESFSDLSGQIANSQIPDAEIGVGKLNVTGTPDGTKFLRDDGSWQTVSGGGGSTEDISLTVSGDSDPYFEVSKDGSDNVVIAVGSGSGAPNGTLTWSSSQGSWFFSSGFTSVTIDSNGWAIPSDKGIRFQEPVLSGDNYAELKSYQGGMGSNYTLYMPASLGTSGQVVGLGSSGQLEFVNRTRCTPTILGSAANVMTVSLPDPDRAYRFAFSVKSAANTNNIFVTFNSDTTASGYTSVLWYSSSAAVANAPLSDDNILFQNNLTNGAIGGGTVTCWRFYDGTNTTFFAEARGWISGYGASGLYTKVVSGDVALTAINIRSNQTNGLATGSKIISVEG